MTAIFTKSIRGSRIKAYAGDNSVTIPYDSSLSMEQAHKKAAIALCNKLGWKGTVCEGNQITNFKRGKNVNVYVFVEDR